MKKIAMLMSLVLVVALLTVPAAAVEFTPSAESKPAPSVALVVDQTGATVAAIIYDGQGTYVIGVPDGDLIVTPVSERDQAPTEISEALKSAYEQIQSVGSLSDLVPGIEQALRAINSELSVSDLVIRDLFDVRVTGTYKEYLDEEGNKITIRFDLNLSPDATLLVLHNYSGSDWEVIDNDRVVINDDGSVDVTFDSLSPVAFVVDAANVKVDPNGPTSPQTGDNGISIAWIAVAALVCVVVTGSVLLRKKRA